MIPRPIVVVGMARSGTTFVERSLAGVPGLVSTGEAFHPNADLRPVWAPQLQVWREGDCPSQWMLSAAANIAPARLAVKALETHLPPADLVRLADAGDAVCCVRHPLTQFVSWKQALATDVWNRLIDGRGMFGKAAKAYRPMAVTVDRDELHRYIAHWREVNAALAGVPRQIPYPRILTEPAVVCEDLAAWLGLTTPPPIGTIRLNADPLAERIANWPEVASWFPWDEFAELNEWTSDTA